jgi:hypothetical protein
MEARPLLLDQVRNQLRTLHYSYRTEQPYLFWVRRFILFHGKRHPAEMAAAEIEAFPTYLMVDRQVSASTQNQALAALRFLYQKVLRIDLPWLDDIVRAKLFRHLPVVLTSGEAKDVQFDCRQLVVRSGKGRKDRSAILPDALVAPLQIPRRAVVTRPAVGRLAPPRRSIRTSCAGARTPCGVRWIVKPSRLG